MTTDSRRDEGTAEVIFMQRLVVMLVFCEMKRSRDAALLQPTSPLNTFSCPSRDPSTHNFRRMWPSCSGQRCAHPAVRSYVGF